MRLALGIGITLAAATGAALHLAPSMHREQPQLGRSFIFDGADVVADAGLSPESPREELTRRPVARNFTFEPVVVAGRVRTLKLNEQPKGIRKLARQ